MDNNEDAFRRALDSIQANEVYRSWVAENRDIQSGPEYQAYDSTSLVPELMCDEFFEAVDLVCDELGEFSEWIETILGLEAALAEGNCADAATECIGGCSGQIGALIVCRKHCVSVLSPGLSHAIHCLSEACAEWNYNLSGDAPVERHDCLIDCERECFETPSGFEKEMEDRLIAVVQRAIEEPSRTPAGTLIRKLSCYYGLHKEFHSTVDTFVRQDFSRSTTLGRALVDLGKLAHLVALMDIAGASLKVSLSRL